MRQVGIGGHQKSPASPAPSCRRRSCKDPQLKQMLAWKIPFSELDTVTFSPKILAGSVPSDELGQDRLCGEWKQSQLMVTPAKEK